MTCPTCGRRHLIGAACPPEAGKRVRREGMPRHQRIVVSLLVIAMTAAALSVLTIAVAEAWGQGRAGAMIIGFWVLMQLIRLGYEHDDGIDVWQLIFPAPFDWSVKIERTIHFWTSPRTWFRCVYLGTLIALVIAGIRLAANP